LNSNSTFRWLRLSAGVALCLASAALLMLSRTNAAPRQASLSKVTTTGGARDVSTVSASPAFSAQELSAPPTQNWLKVGGTLLSQNWSPLKEINRENVGQLKAVWQTHLDGSALVCCPGNSFTKSL
jgi:glucose dehydrogenase